MSIFFLLLRILFFNDRSFQNLKYSVADTKNGLTTLDEKSSFGFQFQSALGLAYSFNKTNGCFVDAGFHQLNTQQFLPNNLSTIVIKLGFVSAF